MKLEFDANSPMTGNKTVLVESDENTNIESRLCVETGYTTKDTWKVGSEAVAEVEKTMPGLVVDTKYTDTELNQYWYLFNMTTPFGSIYPYSKEKGTWYWIVTPVVDVKPEDKEKYPVPGQPGEFYESRLAIELSHAFPKDHFEEALDSFYQLIQVTQLKQQEHAN